jgi:hypothetical protein
VREGHCLDRKWTMSASPLPAASMSGHFSGHSGKSVSAIMVSNHVQIALQAVWYSAPGNH